MAGSDISALTGNAEHYDLGVESARFEDDLLELDRRLTLPEQMLTKVDRATMAIGLEARPPLLDPRVVAIARAVPFAEHVSRGHGKQLLRRVVARLIEPALLDRPKMGFDPPIGEWLRGPLRSWADELLRPDALRASGITGATQVTRSWSRHLSGTSSEEQRLWTILQYQLWFHEVGNRPAKQNMVRNPSEKIAFADAAIADAPNSIIEYSFLEPPTTTFGPTSPSLHFRHAHRSANIAWAELRVNGGEPVSISYAIAPKA